MMKKNYNPDKVWHPGETLNEILKYQRTPLPTFSRKAKINLSDLKKLIKGEKDITKKIAKKLSSVLQISETFWIRLQKNYNIYKKTTRRLI